jgi:hypothetical protein
MLFTFQLEQRTPSMKNCHDYYSEFEATLTDLLTERDGFLERRIKLAAVRASLNKNDARYSQAVERALSVLDSRDLLTL